MNGLVRLICDLTYVFFQVPLASLIHLRQNLHRLVRHTYRTQDGHGCLMNLLTETLPDGQRIASKRALTRYFGCKQRGPDYLAARDPFYQPAKWLVRLWDGQICDGVRRRYGNNRELSVELVMRVLDNVIAERQEMEAVPADVAGPHGAGEAVQLHEPESGNWSDAQPIALEAANSLGG